jgi:hypothetical protein
MSQPSLLSTLDPAELLILLSFAKRHGPGWKTDFMMQHESDSLPSGMREVVEARSPAFILLLPGDLVWLESQFHNTHADPWEELLAASRAFLNDKNTAEQALAAKERLEAATARLSGHLV